MKLTKSKYIHLAIMILLTVIISHLKPFGSVTPYGMKALGVFIGVLYGWIAFDLFWSSIFGFAALGVSGISTVTQAFQTGIGDQMIVTILLVMVFAEALDQMGVTDAVADWMLQRKIFTKSPWSLIIGITLCAFALGLFGTGIAGVIVLWGVVAKISAECGYEKLNPLSSFMYILIPIACFGGSYCLPFHGGTIIYVSYLMQVTDTGIPIVPFFIFGFVNMVLMITILILVAKFILRLDASKFMLSQESLAEIASHEVSRKQKIGLIICLFYILALILPGIFTFPGSAFLKTMGIPGVTTITLLIMAVVSINGEGLFSFSQVFAKVNWQLIILLAVTYPIAAAMRSQDAGIMATVMQYIMPIVNSMGLTLFMIMCTILLGIVTQFTHNVVLAAMFMPFLLPIAQTLGGDASMYTLWFMLFLVLNTSAYCTPAASFPSAMVFGNDNMMRSQAYLIGIVNLVISCIVLSIVGIPLGHFLF